jgi:hypothetical protein
MLALVLNDITSAEKMAGWVLIYLFVAFIVYLINGYRQHGYHKDFLSWENLKKAIKNFRQSSL